MDTNLIFFALCLRATFLSGGANVSHAPRNIVCLSNTKVTIACEASENESVSIGWFHEVGNTSSPHALYNNTGSNVSTNYLMIKTENGGNLVIDSVRLRDAGVYYCTAITRTGESKEVGGHLIVLASNPICNLSNVTVMANDYIRLQCNVTYGGVWRPVMEWTLLGFLEREKIFNDSTLTATIENDVTESQQYTTMTASVQILTKPHHNGISFVCSTHFHRSDMSVKYKVNNNTPDYNHTWISPKINVLYGPTNVAIFPAKDTFYPGDKLTCSASGNPEPQFKWNGNETVNSYNGSQIDIIQSMVSDHRYVFSCKAQNYVSESFANITFTVRSRFPPIYFAIVAIWLLCTLLLMGIIFAIRNCAKGRSERLYAVSQPREDCNEPNVFRDERNGVLNENGFGDYIDLIGVLPRNEARNLSGTGVAENDAHRNEETDPRYVGSDRTQYVRMNLRPDNEVPRTGPVVRHSTIQVSNYASIDHTRKAPQNNTIAASR